ncbi:MAG TPA: NUDIX domain-containing protein [Candidatus Micrarchaeia archaeon]|nr:NUDIX domain-containing protein [Candidatus Micrarchaeia archaeon]
MGLTDAPYRFCPHCGARLVPRPVEAHTLPSCPSCAFVAFRDPKVVVVAIAVDGGGRVLAIRRGIAPGLGEWALPGGYLDYDEHPEHGARRECLEETGCELGAVRLLGVFHVGLTAAGLVVVAYGGAVAAGRPSPTPEATELDFFAPDGMPELAFSSHRQALAAWRAAAATARGGSAVGASGPG